MSRFGTTVKEALGWNGVEFDAGRVEFFRALVWDRIDRLSKGQSVADPINLFVKQEPHKVSKIKDGRYRLISAVSLVDTMVDRLVFGHLEQLVWQHSPILIGWTPVNGGFRWLYEKLRDAPVLEIDKKGWDWSLQPWVVDALEMVVKELTFGSNPVWEELVSARFRLLFEEAVFSWGGRELRQQEKGIMKSGCYLTIFLNSIAQLLLHELAMIRLGWSEEKIAPPYCMGDDTVQNAWLTEQELEKYEAELAKAGCVVGESTVTKGSAGFTFCGFSVSRDRAVPAYAGKHAYQLLHLNPQDAEQTLDAYQQFYCFDRHFLGHVRDGLRTLSPRKLRSPMLMRYKFRGLE